MCIQDGDSTMNLRLTVMDLHKKSMKPSAQNSEIEETDSRSDDLSSYYGKGTLVNNQYTL